MLNIKNNWKAKILFYGILSALPLIIGLSTVSWVGSFLLKWIIGVSSISASLILAVFFVKRIDYSVLGGVRYVSKQLNNVSEHYNLSEKFKSKTNDEIGDLVNILGTVFDRFRDVIAAAKHSADETLAASIEMKVKTQQVKTMTSHVNQAISQIAEGSSNQSGSAASVSTALEEMSQSIQTIAQGANEQKCKIDLSKENISELTATIEDVSVTVKSVLECAENSADSAMNGKEVVDKTVKGMDQIRATVLNTAEKIEKLGDRSQQIGEIVGVIDDIAEQTNLLALNAAIEAARAGEQGKGFAVVADEVRKLAERSAKATKEIVCLISEIQSETSSAVDSMKAGTERVEEGTILAQQAGDALSEIFVEVKEVVDKIRQVVNSTDEMGDKSLKVVDSVEVIAEIAETNTEQTETLALKSSEIVNEVENITAVAEETAASSQEVSASAQEQAAMMAGLTDSSEDLTKLAGRLDDIVSKFDIGDHTYNVSEVVTEDIMEAFEIDMQAQDNEDDLRQKVINI